MGFASIAASHHKKNPQPTHSNPDAVTWANFLPKLYPWHPGLTFTQKQTPGIEAWQKPPARPCPKHTAEGEGRRRARTDVKAHTPLHVASSHLTTFGPQHAEALRLSNTYANIRKPTL